MAEVFGIATGAAGVAPILVELVRSVKRLHDFYNDGKRAPRELKEFGEELDDIRELLAQLEICGLSKAPLNGPGIQSCLRHCKAANEQVSSVVLELQRSFQKHTFLAQVAFPLKKDKVERLTRTLERAKSSLSLACNVYSMWILTTQKQVQQQILQDIVSVVQRGGPEPPHLGQVSSAVSARTNSSNARHSAVAKAQCSYLGPEGKTRLQKSSSLSNFLDRFCSVSTFVASLGWKRCFKLYRVVPWNTSAFEMCRQGDLLGLHRKLATREVSLHDQTTHGETLFTTALVFQQMHIARELHLMGADITSPDQFGDSPLAVFWTSVRYSGIHSQGQIEDVRRSLLFLTEDCELEPGSGSIGFEIQTFLKPASLWTVQEKSKLVQCFKSHGRNDLDTLSLLLGHGGQDETIWSWRTPAGAGIIHFVARECARTWRDTPNIHQSWASVLRLAVDGCADLHAVDTGHDFTTGTPLRAFLYYALIHRTLSCRSLDNLTKALQSWVAALDASGVDLSNYGKNEAALWALKFDEIRTRPRIISFTYGAHVSDWKVLTERPGDGYAGTFWEMVDRPKRSLREVLWPAAEPKKEMWEDHFFQRQQEYYEKRKTKSSRRA